MAKAQEGITELRDLKLAHAIKLGYDELTYVTSERFDIFLHSNLIISVTKKVPEGAEMIPETVYTSVMNAISWRR